MKDYIKYKFSFSITLLIGFNSIVGLCQFAPAAGYQELMLSTWIAVSLLIGLILFCK